MYIRETEMPRERDKWVGRAFLCIKDHTNTSLYKEGRVYTIQRDVRGIHPKLFLDGDPTGLNGAGADWKLLEEENLKVEDFV